MVALQRYLHVIHPQTLFFGEYILDSSTRKYDYNTESRIPLIELRSSYFEKSGITVYTVGVQKFW
jgi:hypothetical protein